MQNCNLKFKSNLNDRCYRFSLNVIAATDIVVNKSSTGVIINQLIRSATSIGANLIEAQSASSRLEFKKFYGIALRSANETKYWLGLLKDTQSIDINLATINNLLTEATEIANMLASGILKLKRKVLTF